MRTSCVIALTVVFALACIADSPAPQVRLERIEWSDVWVVDADRDDLPKVLLVGDSIVKGYYDHVEKALAGKAACARYATSKFLGNPDYLVELSLLLKRHDFDAVHINNGLHGWDYSEAEYRQGLEELLAVLKRDAPKAKIIWCMTTPVRSSGDLSQFDVGQNDRVIARNKIAGELMEAAEIPVNNLYETVRDHPDYFAGDGVHYNDKGRAAQAEQVVSIIGTGLEVPGTSSGE